MVMKPRNTSSDCCLIPGPNSIGGIGWLETRVPRKNATRPPKRVSPPPLSYLRRRLDAEGQAAEIVLGLRLVATQQLERLLPLLLGHANHARRHVLVDLGLESARMSARESERVRGGTSAVSACV